MVVLEVNDQSNGDQLAGHVEIKTKEEAKSITIFLIIHNRE